LQNLEEKVKKYKVTAAKSKRKYKSRAYRLKRSCDYRSSKIVAAGIDEIDQEVAKIKELEILIDEQAEIIDELRKKEIATLDKHCYNHKVRECCMKLLSNNVSIRNVEGCIRAVCDLADQKIDVLPCKSTVANMMVEARSVSHLQLAEMVPKHVTNTLHSDGTTKFGIKYGGLQVTTVDSSYILCLTEMKAGVAQD